MDWVILFLQVVTLALLVMNHREMSDIRARLRVLTQKIDDGKARQSRITSLKSSSSTPHVDAQARTTKRDTNDIPARGGRMSTAVHRNKRDYDGDSIDSNGRLLEGTGPDAAQLGEYPGRPAP